MSKPFTQSALERHRRAFVNEELHWLGQSYHDGLPISQINHILVEAGFNPLEEAIYCGRDGRSDEQVGNYSWFHMTWHKMETTGRYEVVAYVN